ncbi:ABC transporter substrate-binding protein [Marivirga lumbricoides]|uniref:ABC transporter substrate-binding protein n=1 Tax=Marivirga lumbricoides TaxID=1046115 RepID=A0ABQ1MJ68_9BACT|nr:ABC transporter substrate-binding protein [Marivirga lumbricoides]
MKSFRFIPGFLLIVLVGCSNQKESSKAHDGKELIQHSDKLSIQQFDDYQRITVNYSNNSAETLTYILYPENTTKPQVEADLFITTPIKGIICFSTSQLPALDVLNLEEKLLAFPGTQWIYDSTMRTSVAAGKIKDIGQKNGVNIEKILSLQPDLVMGYDMNNSFDNLKAIQQANIPVVINVDYLENSPLGRAEWIKFIASFFQKLDEADSVFDTIEKNYTDLKEIAESNNSEKTTVLTGVMYGDTWYIPGGNSYGARFIQDAGGNYLWTDTQESGSLEMSYESILNKAQNADLWIGAANFKSYEELKNTNTKYTYFDAFRNKKIYSYTKRMRNSGGNDYLESGYLRPDLVLQDHIKIIQPELLEDKPFTYFEPLAD